MAEDKQELSLLNSVNTANPNEDLHSFSETGAPYIENTGIERDGGITNLHLETETYTETGAHFIADDGSVLSVIPGGSDLSTVKIGDKIIGSVSSYGVEKRFQISGVEDCIITVDNSYVTAVVNQSNVILTEYDFNNVVLHTRTITFTSLGAVSTFFTSLSIVRYEGMHYADSFEFALRLGDQVIILQESNPGISFAQAFGTTSVLGTNNINSIIVYKNWLVVAGDGGRVGSYDGQNWKNYDGSGIGTGPYANGTVVSTNNINCMVLYGNSLVVGANGGLIASFDGTKWLAYNSSGTGLYNNASVISTDNVTAMLSWTFGGVTHLIVGGHLGKLGEWDGTAWRLYNGAVGIRDNATLIGAAQINAIAIYTEYAGSPTILVAGASGRVGSFKYQALMTTGIYTAAPGGTAIVEFAKDRFFILVGSDVYTSQDGINWSKLNLPAGITGSTIVTYGAGLYVLFGYDALNRYSLTSTDGISWTANLVPNNFTSYSCITYGNGLFVLLSSTNGYQNATSPDGINWTLRTSPMAGGDWRAIAYGNGTFVAVARTTSTTQGIYTSPDGITWTARTTTAPAGLGWADIVYGNGLFVALADSASTTASIATSLDGITWTFRTTTTPGSNWTRISYGNGLFVVAAGTASTTTGIATSPDGITWTFRTTGSYPDCWYGVACGNGLCIVRKLTQSSYYLATPDTFTASVYTTASTPLYPTNNATVISTDNILTVGDYNGRKAFCGHLGKVGELNWLGQWTNYNQVSGTQDLRAATGPISYKIAYGAGVYVGVNYSTTKINVSLDGYSWSSLTDQALTKAWISVAYGNGLFVAVANTTSTTQGIATSPDGINWTFQTTAPHVDRWNNVVYINGIFVATTVGTSSTDSIATSSDGITWTFQSAPATHSTWLNIVYGNGVYVALSAGSTTTNCIFTTTDFVTWNAQTTSAPGGPWNNIAYGNGIFIVIANSNVATTAVATSSNGITWTFVTMPSIGGYHWADIQYGDGYFLCKPDTYVAPYLYSSIDGASWIARTVVYSGLGIAFRGFANHLHFVARISALTTFSPSITNNAAAVGASAIRTAISFNNTLVVAGDSGRVGSFDGVNWKNYDGSGTGAGLYDNAAILGSGNILCSTIYNSNLTLAASNAINSVGTNYSFTPFYNTGSAVISNLLTGLTNNSYLYVYRYENGMYLVNLVGNALNRSYTLDNTTKAIKILNAGWAIPQVKNGLSRHILTTTNPDYTTVATQVRGTGLVGYTDFANFSADTVYPDNLYAGSAILSKVAGFGYEDFNFRITTSSTDIYNYTSPQPYVNAGGLFQVKQSNTDTLINYYGKMNNNLAVAPTKPIEFRLGMIPTLNSTSGVQSYISAALVDNGSVDNLGVLLTNVGEFDYSYTPQLVADSQILYRYNKNFYIITVSKNPVSPIQRVSEKLYKINSITPLNLIDINSKTLLVGSSDYNGRLFFTSSASPAGSKIAIASIQSSEFANSIDVGDKLLSYYTVTAANFEAIGYRIPSLSASQQYEIDVYVADTYYASILNDGSELVSPAKTGILYTNTPTSPKIIPEAIGQLYVNGTISTPDSTIIMEPDYDGYRIGNQLNGVYTVFTLNNGYSYLFDGSFIYTITLDSVGFITNKRKVAPAGGLKYLATAPTEAYFLSTFDNSIYTFSGGQSLVKARRMNRVDDIQNAVFNVRDNTLLLNATNQLIWVRDGVLTLNEKLPAQTGLRLYSTENGIYLGNDVNSWRYTFKPTDSSVVVPLKWRSAFFGITSNIKSIVSEYVCTIYDESKSAHKIVGKVFTRDPDTYTTQTETWEVTPNMYTDGGYVTLRLKPQTMKSLGTSIGLECNDKIIILDVTAQFAPDTNAVVEAKRSR